MHRRQLLLTLPAIAAAAATRGQAQLPYQGRLRPGMVALSFRSRLETGDMTYEDVVRTTADLGLEGLDMTSYWVPPLLKFRPGMRSTEISDLVRQTPANPGNQWLASLRATAHRNGVQIHSIGSPVKMAQPTPELRQKEIAFAKMWIDMADRLGAGHVRVFGGGIRPGSTEAQAVDWAVEVFKPALDHAAGKGILLGLEDDDNLTWTSAQIFTILKKVDHPFARINLDCGNFRKDGYEEVRLCAPYAAGTHIKTSMATPDGKRETADWMKLFGILATTGYRGYASMEMEPGDGENAVQKYAPELIRCSRAYSG